MFGPEKYRADAERAEAKRKRANCTLFMPAVEGEVSPFVQMRIGDGEVRTARLNTGAARILIDALDLQATVFGPAFRPLGDTLVTWRGYPLGVD